MFILLAVTLLKKQTVSAVSGGILYPPPPPPTHPTPPHPVLGFCLPGFCRSCARCRDCCGFECGIALLCLVNTVFWILSTSLGSYNHSTPSLQIPEPPGEGVRGTSYSGLSTPESPNLCRLTSWCSMLSFLMKYKNELCYISLPGESCFELPPD